MAILMDVVNQTVGDAISDMLVVECVLAARLVNLDITGVHYNVSAADPDFIVPLWKLQIRTKDGELNEHPFTGNRGLKNNI